MKNFQIVILFIFIVGFILGVLVFSGKLDIGSKKQMERSTKLVIWGSHNSFQINSILEELNKGIDYEITYVFKNKNTFEKDLLEALTRGRGPDLFFVDNHNIYKFLNKIYTIPFASYPLINYKNTFSSTGDIFLMNNGTLAFPIAIDPLMLYYNKTILDSNNLPYPPEYWEETNNFVETLNKKQNNEILRSTFAMGQFSNISHAKEILLALFLQSGNNIIHRNERNNFNPILDNFSTKKTLSSLISFYINFSNPLSNNYSWNKGMPSSQNAFAKEDLVFYFGPASDLPILFKKNPNLNFGITQFPQIKNSKFKTTYAKVDGIVISSFSGKKNVALRALILLSNTDFVNKFSNLKKIAPSRRDLLSRPKVDDKYSPIIYSSALYSKSWIDPNYNKSSLMFSEMVEDILSNRSNINDSIDRLNSKIRNLLY